MGPRWWRLLVILAGVVLVSTGCAALQQQASSSPETSPSTSSESPTPSTAPIGTVTPSSAPTTSRPGVLTITNASFHAGEVGIAYAAVTLSATGGVPPYSWSISAGALPGGLQAASGGSVSGTPTSAGTFAFTVHVADTAGGSAIVNRSIPVARHLTVSGLCATQPCSVEQGCTTVCGKFGSQAGGVGPFTYVRTAGLLPPSTSLSHLALAGTFTTVSKYSFVVKVTDALGATGSVSAGFSVFPHIAFSVKSGTCGPSYGCSVSLPFTMGTPGGTPKLSFSKIVCPNPPCSGIAPEPPPNTLPAAGFTAGIGRAGVTITFGSPSITGDWIGALYVTITDQSLCGPGTALCSATVVVKVDTEVIYG